jgi:hypothetical protein
LAGALGVSEIELSKRREAAAPNDLCLIHFASKWLKKQRLSATLAAFQEEGA